MLGIRYARVHGRRERYADSKGGTKFSVSAKTIFQTEQTKTKAKEP